MSQRHQVGLPCQTPLYYSLILYASIKSTEEQVVSTKAHNYLIRYDTASLP